MNSQWTIPALPKAPPSYDPTYMNHLVRTIEQILERARSPGSMEGAKLNLSSLPTSATGLRNGDLWNDSGVVRTAGGGAGVPVTDGDKGDITVSGSGTIWTIDADVVTYAKMQNISSTDRLLGRDTAAAGDTEELTVGGGLEFTGTGGIQTSAFTGDATKTAGGTALTIANNAVSNAKLDDMAQSTFKMRAAGAGTGDPIDGTATQAKTALAIAIADVSDIAATSYTPTLTNVANLAASTATGFRYIQIGTLVVVFGRVTVDPTLTATATELGITLPVASAFAAVANCNGVAFATGIAGQGAGIEADPANDRAAMKWIAEDITNQPMTLIFGYVVV